MSQADPAALKFLLSRRSRPHKILRAPYPTREEMEPILTAALRVPDHKKLEPWRLVVLEGAAMRRLADLAAMRGDATGRTPEEIDKQRAQFANAGLAVAVIVSPVDNPAVPETEQVLSAGAVCLQLVNAALASGWGANWLSGWPSHDPEFARHGLGCAPHESIAGLIHIGTASATPPERPRPDLGAKVSWASE